MLKQTQLTSSVEVITPEVAKAYLKLNGINRPVKNRVVASYRNQIERGLWKENGESICFTTDGKLADGQHRLAAIIAAGVPVRCVVARGCEEGSFATYDSGTNRTNGDTFSVAGIANYTNVAAAVNKYTRLVAKAQFMRGGNGDVGGNRLAKVSRLDLLRIYRENSEVFDEAVKYASRCYCRLRLINQSELAAIIAYLVKDCGYNMNFVAEFFLDLHNFMNVRNTAILLLRKALVKDKENTSSKMKGAHKQALLIKAWNAYVAGSTIRSLTYNAEKEGKIWFAKYAVAQ